MEKYASWSKEDLIRRIVSLESAEGADNKMEHDSKNEIDRSSDVSSDKKQGSKKARPFDMSKYHQRRVAFKVAYFGWAYAGFARQGNEKDIPTVEGQILNALMTTKLITDLENCNYSRCGRTDKGVSALGQVIALDVRSNVSPDGDEKANATELPYVETLNRLLPPDIRILAWAPVSSTFNARFDCNSRTYRYYFAKGDLDIERMREALQYFGGTHDFRNFCKLDPSKNIVNYERTVLDIDLIPAKDEFPGTSPRQTTSHSNDYDMWYLQLKGTAFLWHQVRCMMAILFLIGQGLESPAIIKDLVDIGKYNSKPEYNMASELPLVLYDCEFEPIPWRFSGLENSLWNEREGGLMLDGRVLQTVGAGGTYALQPQDTSSTSDSAPLRLYEHLQSQWQVHHIKSLLIANLINDSQSFRVPIPLSQPHNPPLTALATLAELLQLGVKRKATDIPHGGGQTSRTHRYIKLQDRPRCDSDDTKKQKYSRKKQKVQSAA
ncbi:hypothetical protein BZG36_01685 [Bifiguratus adelaidae]|uniref:Pseudouridine synthase I TruA alpha/beta domain-containing protein n=1 Tax=Bifiguratus adelaidae TaxID=1938954 RepID=A0A261Y4P8_9FUNG|nr:hypothetical protein BZG36_01685 [Bifiguratus adelaidae]